MPVSQMLKKLSKVKESKMLRQRGLDLMSACCLAVKLRCNLALSKDRGFRILRVDVFLRRV